jgi:large subunit ribosomal protein L9
MKVILVNNVENLGQIGQIKEVKKGYAKNYLIPKGFALLPQDPRAKSILLKTANQKGTKDKKDQNLKEKFIEIDSKTFLFYAKDNKSKNLYAAIGPKQIGQKLGIPSELVKESFKTFGKHKLEIKLNDLKANVLIDIQKEK